MKIKRILILILTLFIGVQTSNALAINLDDIETGSYIIGTMEFKPGTGITSNLYILAGTTLEESEDGGIPKLDEIVVYYKSSTGDWYNNITNKKIAKDKLPEQFKINI